MLVHLCVIPHWSGAPVVRCPGSGETQRDSTEGRASLLSQVAPVTQTAPRVSGRCLTSQYLNNSLSVEFSSGVAHIRLVNFSNSFLLCCWKSSTEDHLT